MLASVNSSVQPDTPLVVLTRRVAQLQPCQLHTVTPCRPSYNRPQPTRWPRALLSRMNIRRMPRWAGHTGAAPGVTDGLFAIWVYCILDRPLPLSDRRGRRNTICPLPRRREFDGAYRRYSHLANASEAEPITASLLFQPLPGLLKSEFDFQHGVSYSCSVVTIAFETDGLMAMMQMLATQFDVAATNHVNSLQIK